MKPPIPGSGRRSNSPNPMALLMGGLKRKESKSGSRGSILSHK